MGIKYARAGVDGSQMEFAVADSMGRNVEMLLNEGFLPLEVEAKDGDELCEFECFRTQYRVEEDRIVKYYTLLESAPELVQQRIEEKIATLAQSDYMVVKSYEMSLVGEESEYDLEALHREREGLRDEIRELRKRLN